MPKIDMDYSRSIISKLVCKDVDIKERYVGSTTNFRQRKNNHKTKCNNENAKQHNYFVYKVIRDQGGWDNWDMVLVENYPCQNILELEARERHWVEELKATLNKRQPGRTPKEWYEANKDKKQSYLKSYRETNKEAIKTFRAEKQL